MHPVIVIIDFIIILIIIYLHSNNANANSYKLVHRPLIREFLKELEHQGKTTDHPEKLIQRLDDHIHFTVSLFDAMREGCLILDEKIVIQAANTSFLKLFEVDKEDVTGKLLYDIGNGQWDIPELRKLIEAVLPHNKEINGYRVTHEFDNIGRKVMVLNARMIDHLQLILLAIEDITEQADAADKLNEANESLEAKVKQRTDLVHNLASRLVSSEQNEREKFSALLHDDLQQILVALQMNLKLLNKKAQKLDPDEPFLSGMQKSLDLLENAISTTRELTSDLNPSILNTEDLSEILDWLKKKFSNMYNFETVVSMDSNYKIVDKNFRRDLIQILREALFNVVKHADVDTAEIKVSKKNENNFAVQLADQGKGFDIKHEKESFGLSNLRDRAYLHGGEFEISTEPDQGTRLKFEFP